MGMWGSCKAAKAFCISMNCDKQNVTSITAFHEDCKRALVHSKMSSLGDANCNASFADWLTVHSSCDCLFQSLTGMPILSLATAYFSLSLSLIGTFPLIIAYFNTSLPLTRTMSRH